jgi:predicted lipoprotein with Yx(FWY)xxD motif
MKQLLSSRLKALAIVLGAIGAATMLVAAAQAKVSSKSRVRDTGTVVGLRKTAIGTILVDSRGRTLYLFEKDKRGHSACSGTCATYWPPLVTHGKPIAANGARKALLGTIRRADGSMQVTYAGHPVYRFLLDSKHGQTKGEGLNDFGGGWDALTPAGKKIEGD